MDVSALEKYESEVRSYCRSFPATFDYAKGSVIRDTDGKEYIDFFNGAGALNYGHNNDYIKQKVVDYFLSDKIVHALDMRTLAKGAFLEFFQESVLKPRGLDYKIQFPSPTGTNAVEAALKLARKVKGRAGIWCLMGCFHGMSLGALALTSDLSSRRGAGISLDSVTHIPAPYMFGDMNTLDYMETLLTDDHSGIEKPAAIVIETVQAEGGVYVMQNAYLKGLRVLCDRHGILLIIDDIQVGCGRTGSFFSFERAGIAPDILLLSKSIGGYGLPLALTLMRPELDIWSPGEHSGTFRGCQPSLVAAKAGLEFMLNENIEAETRRKGDLVSGYLRENMPELEIRGIGLIWGIETSSERISGAVMTECFENGLILERAGRNNSVVKLMPALTIDDDMLLRGLDILCNAIKNNMDAAGSSSAPAAG